MKRPPLTLHRDTRFLLNAVLQPARRAFTLLEVLLAMALTFVLLLSVYQGIFLYFRLTTQGEERFERFQIARGLYQQLASDLQSAIPPAPSQSSSFSGTLGADSATGETGSSLSLGSSSSGSEDEEEPEPLPVDPIDLVSAGDFGLVGDEMMLIFVMDRPIRKTSQPLLTGPDESASFWRMRNRKLVAWFLAETGAGGLPDALAGQVVDDDLKDARVKGVARLETPHASEQMLITNPEEDLVLNSRILAKEVEELDFSYFDGFEWVDSWDSKLTGGLPQSIKVHFILSSEESPPEGMTYRSAGLEHEFVIRLPRSAAPVESDF